MKHVAAVFILSACATPKAATAPPAHLVSPLDSLAFYVGEWTCDGTQFATKDAPEQHWKAKMHVTPALDGTWLSVEMLGPGMNRTAEHKGYDPTAKQWIHVAVGTEGSWGVYRSAGWSGAQMVFTPDDKADHTVSTFTRIDERHYSHAVATETGEHVWQKVCTKV
jgi:hypothetical protein